MNVSVIIPVYNCEETIELCVQSILNASYRPLEIIVVDDGSTDGTIQRIRQFPCRIISLQKNAGTGYCRNLGASHAEGEMLFFTDSDVYFYEETIEKGVETFLKYPSVSAVIGSYSNETRINSFASRYKQLVLHYIHQISRTDTYLFCGFCGMIRAKTFFDIGGFDSGEFNRLGEDIDLGARLYKKGHKIFLQKEMQVEHLKKYTVPGLIHNDIFKRAIPWTRYILKHQFIKPDVCTRWEDVFSVILSYLLLITASLFILTGSMIPAGLFVVFLTSFVVTNWNLLKLFKNRYGIGFSVRGGIMRFLFYLTAPLGSLIAVFQYYFGKIAGIKL